MANETNNDYEEVLRVFPESVPGVWKDNPEVVSYLSDLSSLGLQRLSQEPERLTEEKAAILEQTQDLAFHNYKTFIQAAECSHEIFQDFNIIESRLESLLDNLPKFGEKCHEFAKEAQQINARWHQASLTLTKHPQLLEILEMPQLMDTYVRNGYYEEALELASYVRRLDRKHSSIPLISSIVKDVQITLCLMLSQLLMQLRSHIQLPMCLKVIGYLRRMDVFSESELRIKFLQARDSWFQGILNDIPRSDSYHHIIKVIESSRTHLFDIITQYRAIFSDDDPLLLSKENSQNESAIFHSWIALKVSEFLHILEEDLALNVGDRIDSVLAQCMYFGLSFSRVGMDFRPLLVPIFERAVTTTFSLRASAAASKFVETMQSYTITNYITPSVVIPSSSISEDNLQPPHSLLDFYPLAQYCNNILSSFNELRLCASLAVVEDVSSSLKTSLNSVVSTIVDFHAAEKSSLTKNEEELFSKFCIQFANELLPHLDKCLTILFPPVELAKVLGITLSEFNKMGKIGRLDVHSIISPLENIMPPKEEDVGITITVGKLEPDALETVAPVEGSSKNTENAELEKDAISSKSD